MFWRLSFTLAMASSVASLLGAELHVIHELAAGYVLLMLTIEDSNL